MRTRPQPTTGVGIFVRAVINGNELEDILDIDEFFRSPGTAGLQPLFTCDCGNFGCGGYYVYVDTTPSAWVLRNRYHPLEKQLVTKFEYQVAWSQVRDAARRIAGTLGEVHAARPEAQIFSGVYGQDLTGQIADYSKLVENLNDRG